MLDTDRPTGVLRRGWTTGACATAATAAAYEALVGVEFPDPVEILLPGGRSVAFALAFHERTTEFTRAAVVKDAGDDPDVTHGMTIVATLRQTSRGSGISFSAGEGVGTVTLPGLPLAVGEPAINPVPRKMMISAIEAVAARTGGPLDINVEISAPGGAQVALKTWNPRLGILGGISILGTSGIVIPYSCSAWIHSIRRGIDVARALDLRHVAGCTGSTSEIAVQRHHRLSETAMLDMGDFAGGMLKYLKSHPVDRVTIGGGFAKLSKLAVGHLDLHSGRSQIDLPWLAQQLAVLGADTATVAQALEANSALHVLQLADAAGLALAAVVVDAARATALQVLDGAPIEVDVVAVDRDGRIRAAT